MSNRRKQANPRSLKISMDNGEVENQTELVTPFNLCPETTNFDFDEASRSSVSLHDDSSDDTLETEAGASWQSESPDERRTPPTPSSCATPNSASELPEVDLTYTIGVTEATPYSCQFCTKAFPRLSYLKKHEQTHDDKMPFKCDFCSRLFKYKRSRDRHVKLHTGDKKYRCTYCEAAFSRSDHLKIHLRTHDNGKPFQCVTCNRGYNTAAALTSHMQNHKKQQRLQQEQQQQQQQQEQQPKLEQSVDASQPQIQKSQDTTVVQSSEISPKSDSQIKPPVTPTTTENSIPSQLQTDSKTPISSSSAKLSARSRVCDSCGLVLQSPTQLRKHRFQYHYNEEAMFQSWKPEIILENSQISLPSETPIIPTTLNSKLVCIYCSEDFNTMDDLKVHVDEKHDSIISGEHQETFRHFIDVNNSPSVNQLSISPISEQIIKLTCYLCSMQFLDIQTFQVHLFNVHHLVMNSCPHCAQHFDNPEQMADHFFRAHQSTVFSEQMKPTDLSRKNKLPNIDIENHTKRLKRSNGNALHIESTSTTHSQASSASTPNQLEYNNVLLCNQCNAAFPDFEAFRDHVKIHLEHVDNIRTVLSGARMTDASQSLPNFRRILMKSSPTTSSCPHCKMTFKERNELERHIITHFLAASTEYYCKACLKKFSTDDQLQKHLFDLHIQQVLRCSLCKEIFETRAAMQVHFIMKHNTENPLYSCTACPSDSRPIFRTDKAAKIHFKTVHLYTPLQSPPSPTNGSRLLRCQFCLIDFNSDVEFQLHLTMHFQPYKCPVCQKTFQVEYLLERHIQEYHQRNRMANGSNSEETVDHQLNQRLPVLSDLTYPLLSTKSSMEHHDQATNCIKLETPDYKINTCDVCDRNDFANESELISHRKIVHHMKSTLKNGVVSLHCAYCNENCKSRTELESHMKNHSQSSGISGKHKCNICDELCPSAALLAEHKLTHCKVVAGNSCTRCKATLHTDEQFYTHLVQHSNTKNNNTATNQINLPFPCVICRQTLISNIEVQMHAQFHVRNTTSINTAEQQCILCFKPLEKSNMTSNNQNSNNLLCKDCFTHHSYSLAMDVPKQDMQKLNSNPLPNKKYSCIRCQLSFNTESEIQNHLTTHLINEGSQHECHLCRNKFSTPLKLQIHLIEHTFAGFGSYTCYLCSAVFTAAQGLHSHMLEHGLANRPYDCQKCNARFFFRAELDNHNYVHLQDTHNLHIQSKELANSYPSDYYRCMDCPQTFTDVAVFFAHIGKMHQNKNDAENQNVEGVEENKQPITMSAPSDNEYIEIESPNSIRTVQE